MAGSRKSCSKNKTSRISNLRTYDDTGWTMGLMSHAQVLEIGDKAVLEVPVEAIDTLTITGTVKGDGPLLAVLDNGSNSLVTLRYRLKSTKFEAIEQPFKVGDTELPAGSFLIQSSPEVKTEIQKLGLKAIALKDAPKVPKHNVDLPRLAVFTTWGSTQDVGWVRYAFDHFELNYDLIYKERVRQGHLRDSYDVIVIPNQGRGSKSIVFDIESKKALDYKQSDEFKSLGEYGSSNDITGGMGLLGVEEFEKFVHDGGVLITLGCCQFLSHRLRNHANCGRRSSGSAVLRSRTHCRSRDSQADASDFLRLHGQDGPRSLRQRSAASSSARRSQLDTGAFPGNRSFRAEWSNEGSCRNEESTRDRRCSGGTGPRSALRDEPLLPLAESRRIQYARELYSPLQ